MPHLLVFYLFFLCFSNSAMAQVDTTSKTPAISIRQFPDHIFQEKVNRINKRNEYLQKKNEQCKNYAEEEEILQYLDQRNLVPIASKFRLQGITGFLLIEFEGNGEITRCSVDYIEKDKIYYLSDDQREIVREQQLARKNRLEKN